MLHDNSIESNKRLETKLRRRLEIMRAYKALPVGATDREIMAHLGYTELAKVQPRITELIQEGHLKEIGKTKDWTTGRTVRMVMRVDRYMSVKEDLFG